MDFLQLDAYHVPQVCKECGGVMVYKGVGEYRCEDCNSLDFDDYGKVRAYIEENKGATAVEIEAGTGVSQKKIRRMLKESRLEVAAGSRMFMYCESCHKPIRSGTLCAECEIVQHRKLEAQTRLKRKGASDMHGIGVEQQSTHGERRFKRDDRK